MCERVSRGQSVQKLETHLSSDSSVTEKSEEHGWDICQIYKWVVENPKKVLCASDGMDKNDDEIEDGQSTIQHPEGYRWYHSVEECFEFSCSCT